MDKNLVKPQGEKNGSTDPLKLRGSVATLDRVIFAHPQSGIQMLALERRATGSSDAGGKVHVCGTPFGGGVHILNPSALQAEIGPIQYDSERSQSEQDFRILISPADWEAVQRFCLEHLGNPNDTDLESLPDRELREEFAEVLGIDLRQDQYQSRPTQFVIENVPTPTDFGYARGLPTVRLYRIFEISILDDALYTTMLYTSQQWSDEEVATFALKAGQNGFPARYNTILTLPLDLVTQSYLALPREKRSQAIVVEGHLLDESVSAILEGIEIPRYWRK